MSIRAADTPLTLRFDRGTLVLEGRCAPAELAPFEQDARSNTLRAPAHRYVDCVRSLARIGATYKDEARAYQTLDTRADALPVARPYQAEALAAWLAAKSRGVVVLPTGAGKTQLAKMAIHTKQRSTLVVVPTLNLVGQWHNELHTAFGTEIGVLGGGSHSLQPITITTYDSAYLHADRIGDRWGLVVFDECHHLPGASYAHAAQSLLAPFRLGLTATPERTDGRHALTDELCGPVVYQKHITELSGEFLADYYTEILDFDLNDEEARAYEDARALYKQFVQSRGITMRSPSDWSQFVKLASTSAEGRAAMEGFRRSRTLAFGAEAKLAFCGQLLADHPNDKAIFFTQDNHTARRISQQFLVPLITHETKVAERMAILKGLTDGTYAAVVTSKVLNEGVDVPEASLAVVVSGSGSVREHVQRLGRILRRKEGKVATLYELVTRATVEGRTSERRREHDAYR